MSGTTRTSAGLDVRRRQVLYRAWHRGMREMDLIMGRFADAAIAELSTDELRDFARLLEVPDPELYAWVTGERQVPVDHDSDVFRRLRAFHLASRPT